MIKTTTLKFGVKVRQCIKTDFNPMFHFYAF